MERIFAIEYTGNLIVNCKDLETAIVTLNNCKIANDENICGIVEVDRDSNIIRYIVDCKSDVGPEWCSNCGSETPIKNVFYSQYCVECGELIRPCHLCNMDLCKCSECPLKGENAHFLGGIIPYKK